MGPAAPRDPRPPHTRTPAEAPSPPAELVFAPGNGDKPQTVTVTGVDDSVQDGAQAYKIHVGPVTSDDARYAALPVVDRDARNADDEFAAGVSPTGPGPGSSVALFHLGASGAAPRGGHLPGHARPQRLG